MTYSFCSSSSSRFFSSLSISGCACVLGVTAPEGKRPAASSAARRRASSFRRSSSSLARSRSRSSRRRATSASTALAIYNDSHMSPRKTTPQTSHLSTYPLINLFIRKSQRALLRLRNSRRSHNLTQPARATTTKPSNRRSRNPRAARRRRPGDRGCERRSTGSTATTTTA